MRFPSSPAAARPGLRARSGLFLLALVACAEPPEAVRPLRPEGLEPEVAALLDERVRAVERAPADAAARGELGLAYEANGLWPEAQGSFAQAAALDPGEPAWGLHAAIAALQAGDLDASLATLQALVARAPDYAPAQERLGDLLLESGRDAEAAACFQRTAQLAPRSPQGAVGLGRVALARQDHAEAIRCLERALRLDARHATARFLLAQAYRRAGREADAEALGARAQAPRKRFLPDEASARLEAYALGTRACMTRAKRCLESGDAEQAVAILEGVAQASPGREDVANNLAVAYARAGRPERAVRVLEQVCAEGEAGALTHVALALACLDAGDPARALASAHAAVERDPGSSRAHYALGSALLRLARPDEARTALERAHALHRKDPLVRLALGEACLALGRHEEAEPHLREAVLRLADSAHARTCLARALLEGQRLDEARAALEDARRLAPRHRDVAELEVLLAARERER